MKQETAVEWLESNLPTAFKDLTINKQLIVQAKEMEKQQKIAYKIATPLGHVSYMIEKIEIELAIEDYKCKVINAKESVFWNDCLKIAEFYKSQIKNK
jgi:hypothetical protein